VLGRIPQQKEYIMGDIEDVDLSADVPLAAFLRRVSRIIENRFDQTGEVPPSWALITAGGKAHLVMTPFPATDEDPCGDNAKKAGVAFMRDYFREHDVVRYAFVAEAWQGAKSASVRPSMDPSRTAVVWLIAEDRGGAITALREIIRPANGKPYLAKLGVDDGPHAPGYAPFGNLIYQRRPRSSDELPDNEGTVFVTNVPGASFQIMGRRGPTGELFVGSLLPTDKFASRLQQAGRALSEVTSHLDVPGVGMVEIVTGQEAERLVSDVIRSRGN
jgi:hypothetical protein